MEGQQANPWDGMKWYTTDLCVHRWTGREGHQAVRTLRYHGAETERKRQQTQTRDSEDTGGWVSGPPAQKATNRDA